MTTLSLGAEATVVSLSVRRDRALRLQHRQEFRGLVLEESQRAARLDVEPYQKFDIRAAQVEAPIRELEGHAVDTIEDHDLQHITGLEDRDRRLNIGNPKIELTA